MKTLLPLIIFTVCFAPASYSQIPSPSPTPSDDGDVVKISTALIQIDVTVTDKSGKIVSDLRSDEIEIYENGKKQDISNFSFISSIRDVTEKPRDRKDQPVVLPPSTVRPEQVRRTIALVVDDLTLSFESTYFVRRALKKFVDEQMQEGDLVAIIRTGAGIGALQQFTNDRRQLYAAIEKVRWNSSGAGGIGAFAPLEARVEGDDDEPEPGERTREGVEREFNDFRENLFAAGTLGAINYIVRGMQDLPGRKSVMLLSDGFSLFNRDAAGNVQANRVLDSLRRLVDMANRASVVIYTMDARGLQYTGITAADNTSGRSAEQIEQSMSERRDRLFNTQEGLRYLARQTGGLAIINNNDLSGGIRKILDDQSYYLVGYQPEDETFDPKIRRFNKLEVKVTRPGTRVRYRSGFFGISDEKMVRPKDEDPNRRLMMALTSPFAVNDLAVRLNTLFYNNAREGSFVRSLVHIKAQDLKFTDEPNGEKKAIFDIFAVGFGDNGVPVDQIAKTYTISMKKDVYERITKTGLVYDFSFPIKKPGAYQLRVALRDHGSDKLGSANQFVEVPNVKKNRLVLSGVALENVSFSEWKNRVEGKPSQAETTVLTDTSLRQFKRGSILVYGITAYNPKRNPQGTANLTYQTRLFRDGKPIYEGEAKPIPDDGKDDSKAVGFSSALQLGTVMEPGDYVLQITIIDSLAKEKRKTASQFVQFEVLE